MKINEWAKLHGFSDEDAQLIDIAKKLFGGKIELVESLEDRRKREEEISRNNKTNIDRIFIK